MRNDQKGSVNVTAISLIVTVLFLLVSIGFGAWAFMSREDYKNNVDQKIAAAQEVTKKETETAKDNEFLEKEKQPLKKYQKIGRAHV